MEQILSPRQIKPTPQPLNLTDKISGAVISEWGQQTLQYTKWWEWYDSVALDMASPSNKAMLKMPLRINPIKWVCNKHGRGLFGEVTDSDSSMVQFSFRNDMGETDDCCQGAGRIVERIWRESSGADLQMENATISQIVGGSVFRIQKQDWNKRLSTGFRINKVIPDYFLPVWSDDDPWNFPECWVMQYITGDEAKGRYGVDVGSMPWTLYVEHWTTDKYAITINNEIPDMAGMSGANPYGFVPFVYIPHLTRAGGRYGLSHVPGLIKMVEELNGRMSDRGDGVRNINFNRLYGRNLPSTGVKVIPIGNTGEVIIDIGKEANGMTGKPEVFHVEPSAIHGAAVSREFILDLMDMIYSDSDTPGIMFGPSVEGSQPSGDSRDLEFWPYLQHQSMERAMTTIGYNQINSMLLQMMEHDKVGGVTKDMLKLAPHVQWGYPMPKRRDLKVQEVVSRRTTEPPTISLENSVRQLGEGENIMEELALIAAEVEEKQKQVQMKAEQDQKMAMETQRQNMMMKIKGDMAVAANNGKSAPSQEK